MKLLSSNRLLLAAVGLALCFATRGEGADLERRGLNEWPLASHVVALKSKLTGGASSSSPQVRLEQQEQSGEMEDLFHGLKLPPMNKYRRMAFDEAREDPSRHDRAHQLAAGGYREVRQKEIDDWYMKHQPFRHLEIRGQGERSRLMESVPYLAKQDNPKIGYYDEMIKKHSDAAWEHGKPRPVPGTYGGLDLPLMRPSERASFETMKRENYHPTVVHRWLGLTAGLREAHAERAAVDERRPLDHVPKEGLSQEHYAAARATSQGLPHGHSYGDDVKWKNH